MATKEEELKSLIEQALKEHKNSNTKKGKTLRFTEKELSYIDFLKDVLPPEYMATSDSDVLRLTLLAYTFEEWQSLLEEPEENYEVLKSWIEKGVAFRPYDVLNRRQVLGLSKEFADLELHYEQAKAESEKRLERLEKEEKEQAEIIKEESKVKTPEVQDLQTEIERLRKENSKLRNALQDSEHKQAKVNESEVEVIILYDTETKEVIENVDVDATTGHGLYNQVLTEITKHKGYTFNSQEVKAFIKENLKQGTLEIPLMPLEKTSFSADDFIEREPEEEGDDETTFITFGLIYDVGKEPEKKQGEKTPDETYGIDGDFTYEELEKLEGSEVLDIFEKAITIVEEDYNITLRFADADKYRARKYNFYSGEVFNIFVK